MRDFFINSFEKLISAIIILTGLGVLLAAFGAWAEGGFLGFLAVLLFGGVYVIFVGGISYLGLGIYHNTRRSAEAAERQAAITGPTPEGERAGGASGV